MLFFHRISLSQHVRRWLDVSWYWAPSRASKWNLFALLSCTAKTFNQIKFAYNQQQRIEGSLRVSRKRFIPELSRICESINHPVGEGTLWRVRQRKTSGGWCERSSTNIVTNCAICKHGEAITVHNSELTFTLQLFRWLLDIYFLMMNKKSDS